VSEQYVYVLYSTRSGVVYVYRSLSTAKSGNDWKCITPRHRWQCVGDVTLFIDRERVR